MALRAFLVLLFAGLTATAALLGALPLALVTAFVAVALVVDSLFPGTGLLRADSEHAFQRLVWQRRRGELGRRLLRHDHGHLELLPDELAATAGRRHLGVHPIALDSITGTVDPEKAVTFDGAFRPPSWSQGRWQLMWIAGRRGQSLPPISVYRLHGRHFVVDGHHRVSVARALEVASIDADVIELLPLGATPGALRHAHGAAGRERLPETSAPKHMGWGRYGWRPLLLCLSIGLGLIQLSGVFAPVPGYVLILAACAFIGWGLGSPVHTGLEDHRQ